MPLSRGGPTPRPRSWPAPWLDPVTVTVTATWPAKVLTVSESVSRGTREDRSGDALTALLTAHGFSVTERRTVPDGVAPVVAALRDLAASFSGLVVTTGGTGFSPTDLTPEATRAAIEREAPGLAEAMRATSPLGRLTRGMAGTIGACLVLNVPGSPQGAVESMEAVLDVVPHALELLAGHHPH
jgi:molybdopterin adenylyltransferase